jgi:hypothetical protein
MKRKPKSGEPSLRERLSQKFLEALQEDFELYGKTVLEKMRESHPERYAELAAKMIMTAEPQQNPTGIGGANSMHDVGARLLQSIGMVEPDDAAIAAAIEANDAFLAALEAIRDRAPFGEPTNGNGAAVRD